MKTPAVGTVGSGWVPASTSAPLKRTRIRKRGPSSAATRRAQAKATEYSLTRCRALDRLEEMLRDANMHFVAICTPHRLHVPQVAAARAGKHLVVEKPLALHLADMRELQLAVRARA